ncbi:MAG: thiamine phosphate synthase [Gammaproteobacteria bacterium]|nr:thiamine phosphate synthase [Gammaproteobacteria bacterium]
MKAPALRGLYLIADTGWLASGRLVAAVATALDGGGALVQYRNKAALDAARRDELWQLAALCRARGVPLIVNDDLALAREIGADGVHLGRDDATVAEARRALGDRVIVGASCYNRLDLAQAAARAGADYVAFGSFFPSPTKPDAVRADPDLLRRARAALDLPLAAIGGITPENGAAVLEAGADMLAVASGVFTAADPAAAARAYTRLFAPAKNGDRFIFDPPVRGRI